MAVSTPQGLMVPIIKDCDKKSLPRSRLRWRMWRHGSDGKLKLEEMQGGSFTITNGGVFGSLSTPILNAPQLEFWARTRFRTGRGHDGAKIRPMMYLAHSDHRLVDGRKPLPLVKVKEATEDPERRRSTCERAVARHKPAISSLF